MNSLQSAQTLAPDVQTTTWQRALKIFVFNVVIWTVLSALGALTSLNDDLRDGVQGSYWLILRSWGGTSAALACLSFILYYCFSRWPRVVSSAWSVVGGYGLMLLVLLPLQLIFLTKLYVGDEGDGLTWGAIQQQILAIDEFASLLRLTSISAVYFAVAALKIWQQSQLRARAWAQAQADSLALRLELEQQRGLALRAQLEPHFVFNALNAISALVRSDNKDVALAGIHGLSELLRYALSASEQSWVRFSDELGFVQAYLALQRLRYGARLQIVIEGADELVLACECPPLLLQPLVENALRHDLDCHDDPSDIRIVLACRHGQLSICVSNPLHTEAANNPGIGLGLRNIQARLQLAYGACASMQTSADGGRFQVELRMPAHAADGQFAH